jgi:hypothetical protein
MYKITITAVALLCWSIQCAHAQQDKSRTSGSKTTKDKSTQTPSVSPNGMIVGQTQPVAKHPALVDLTTKTSKPVQPGNTDTDRKRTSLDKTGVMTTPATATISVPRVDKVIKADSTTKPSQLSRDFDRIVVNGPREKQPDAKGKMTSQSQDHATVRPGYRTILMTSPSSVRTGATLTAAARPDPCGDIDYSIDRRACWPTDGAWYDPQTGTSYRPKNPRFDGRTTIERNNGTVIDQMTGETLEDHEYRPAVRPRN